MKNILIFFAVILALCSCNISLEEEIIEPAPSFVEQTEETLEPEKELLKLGHELEFDPSIDFEPEYVPSNIPFEAPEELVDGYGKGIDLPEKTKEKIKKLCSDFNPDENWHITVNYYTDDFSCGLLKLIYYIDDFIETDKSIVCNINDGYITNISFGNLTKRVNENAVIEYVKVFDCTHIQEKHIFKEDEELLSEDFNYIYYYSSAKLIYQYQLFYYNNYSGLKVINNDCFSEYLIQDFT